jgi:3-oxoacyl-(acyl-carrier-protein) synthase
MALDDAKLAPGDIDVVCGSASGLAPFDAAELEGVREVCGARACVAAPKTYFGETFGAGGAFGLATSLAWLAGTPVGPVVHGAAPAAVGTVLVVAVGFYGNVSAVVLAR